MSLITANDLTKVFRRPVKDPGLAGSLKHLFTRRFETTTAVDHIDMSITAGEAVAYVGPNGAGKSTTVKLLCGILVPSSGNVQVGGVVPHRERVANARQIGVLFGQRTQLWWDLRVGDSLELLRDMYGVGARDYRERLEHFDAVLGLGELLPVVARKLSLGQRMRADLAAALLHQPRIVYLDEPTIGLDIAVKDRVRAFLRELVAAGTTLILTTHDLGDIEDVCRRIAIIDGGRIIYDGDLSGIKDSFARYRSIHLVLREPVDLQALSLALPCTEVTSGEVTSGEVNSGEVTGSGAGSGGAAHDPASPGPPRPGAKARELTVRFDRFALTAGQVIASVSALSEVDDLRIDEPTIEDVVRKVYSGELQLDRS
jgi:ABC-2 type transport system ATP-binding protein